MKSQQLFISITLVLSGRSTHVAARLPARNEEHHDGLDRELQILDDNQCPGISPNGIKFNFSKDFFFQKVNVSFTLCDLVNSDLNGNILDLVEEQRKNYERFDGFQDINDQAIVAKTKDTGICFVSFQPTLEISRGLAWVLDQLQNINPLWRRIGNTDCKARLGYIDAYNASYKVELRQSLDACVASCPGGCELVLAGYSQGASAAVVAAMDLDHYNPESITFGTPKTILKSSPCTIANKPRHYQFVNAGKKEGYDSVPYQINIFGEKPIGQLFILDDFNFPILIPENTKVDRTPLSMPLHEWPIYRERLLALGNIKCFPLPAAKWPADHFCRYDDECIGNNCLNRRCNQGL